MTPEVIVTILAAAVQSGTPILYATLGEILTEKSGILNLGVEGIMSVGAFAAFITAKLTGSPAMGFLAGGFFGSLLAARARTRLLGFPGQPGSVRPCPDHIRGRPGQLSGHALRGAGNPRFRPVDRSVSIENLCARPRIFQPRPAGISVLRRAPSAVDFSSLHRMGAQPSFGGRVSRSGYCGGASGQIVPMARRCGRRMFHGIRRSVPVPGLHALLDQRAFGRAGVDCGGAGHFRVLAAPGGPCSAPTCLEASWPFSSGCRRPARTFPHRCC